ncbi:MAG: hypothetical protein AABO41_06150 [Acidobacteriota bacterium]
MISKSVRGSLSLVLALVLVSSIQGQQAGSGKQSGDALAVCDRERALYLVEAQVDEAKAIDNAAARIGVLIRAADTLWPSRRDTSRAVFVQAYDLAQKDFQEKSEKRVRFEDQRFGVIQAISRHDPAWARQLAKGAVDETRHDLDIKAGKDDQTPQKTALPADASAIGDKFLLLAFSMLDMDKQAAVDLARTSLRYPASYTLAQFVFKLAGADQGAGDQFYQEALSAYANSSIRSLLLLSAYPFGSARIVIGPESVVLVLPPNFAPNQKLQQLFLGALFQRAEMSLNPANSLTATNDRSSEPAQLYIALNILEPVIAQYQPGFLAKAMTLRVAVSNLLYPEVRQAANSTVQLQLGEGESFADYAEKAEKAGSSERRDYFLVFAVLKAPDDERVDRLVDLAQKVTDSKIRQQLLNWLFFKRTQKAVKQGHLYDAKKLAEKVEELDLRAYLAYEIAAESLRSFDDKAEAREALDTVAALALKADNTSEKARTLLGISNLYSKIDHVRASEIMADAVKAINRITSPDLSDTGLLQKIEGPRFATYARYEVAGFSLENTFRDLAPFDFEKALWLAGSLEDKVLRSTAIIAISSPCLEKAPVQEKPEAIAPRNEKMRLVKKPAVQRPRPKE